MQEKSLSQTQVAKQLNTSISVISCYERGEMTPSIATAKNLAELLDTTVGYLLGETDEADLLKDPDMVKNSKTSFLSKQKIRSMYSLHWMSCSEM
ncbi:MAG: helix-turn-helix transcriptional regulator [Bacteroidota bacterium]